MKKIEKENLVNNYEKDLDLFNKYIEKKHLIQKEYCLSCEACLVKLSFHIRGIIYINQKEIGFYSYETTAYIRHGQSRSGTGNGENLYRGQQIRKYGSPTNPKLSINFSGVDMQDGYEYHSPGQVLESVMSGIRFPFREMTWSGSYDGKYFSYSGEPKRAFDLFEHNFYIIAKDIFMGKWREFGW